MIHQAFEEDLFVHLSIIALFIMVLAPKIKTEELWK